MAEKFKVITPDGPVKRILPEEGVFEINQDMPDSIIEKFVAAGVTEYFEEIPAEAQVAEADSEKKN